MLERERPREPDVDSFFTVRYVMSAVDSDAVEIRFVESELLCSHLLHCIGVCNCGLVDTGLKVRMARK